MPNNLKKCVLLIGASQMSIDYAKVLIDLNLNVDVISRGKVKAIEFKKNLGIEVLTGGLEFCLKKLNPNKYDCVINAVGQEQLFHTTSLLIENGFGKLLIEKPGGLNADEIRNLADLSNSHKASVFIAYNRRFYSSVLEAQKIIATDGGVSSFNFEFTELSHEMKDSKKTSIVKENWFLCNSSHVVDMAFYLGGQAKDIVSYVAGSLEWHPSSSKFTGAGRTENGALFSYQADWAAPGRWGVEILTDKHRLIFRPLEKLQIQEIGSFCSKFYEIDDELDKVYKPGLYRQVQKFLTNKNDGMCSINEHVSNLSVYDKIISGKNNFP
jgi:predicted dehydrogenase